MSKLSKAKQRWNRQLKRKLAEEGVTGCEWFRPCRERLGLAPAHRKKQRFILDEEEYMKAALLCHKHHHYAEYGDRKHRGTHRRMFRIITALINRRMR